MLRQSSPCSANQDKTFELQFASYRLSGHDYSVWGGNRWHNRSSIVNRFTSEWLALAQATGTQADSPNANQLTIPSGTKVPLSLKQAVSTKNARDGDAVYAVTTFPVVVNERIVIPAGTYVQGRVSNVKRGGHVKGRAEVLIHFSTLIYPSGYTVILPGAVENVPGAEKTSMKDEEGTIRQDSQTGEKAKTVATAAGTGALIGGLRLS